MDHDNDGLSVNSHRCLRWYLFRRIFKKGRLTNLLEINISNLAGVPSIIYGLLGLEVFGRILGLGNTILWKFYIDHY